MDFTILEARNFVSTSEISISRTVKNYEIDMECSSGRIYSYGGFNEYRLSFGDVLIKKPNTIASAKGEQNSYLLTLDFSSGGSIENYSRTIPGAIQPPFENELISRLEPIIHPYHINDIISIYQKLVSLPNRNCAPAKELVHELIYLLNAEISKKNYETLKPTESFAQTIMTYLSEHLSDRVTLDDLSRLIHLEKSYLLRLFRNQTGKTPIEALIEMRLAKASDLITSTDLNVYEIAAHCGYTTASFFITAYKKHYGITPEAHRQMLRKK
ncbi:MAG: helix-turn-helix transcriptional regulator [Ruminococcaceae bacterium]|nr:helix-turn-helix transcriptional regulator [Oscillospiraceae bacterium]